MTDNSIEKLWALIEEKYLAGTKESLQKSFANHLEYSQAKTRYTTQPWDCYRSLAFSVRDRLIEKWNDTNQTYFNENVRKVYYLSLEFLMGRAMNNALLNLGIDESMKEALGEFGFDIEELTLLETDAGLGNGGLGRLAACFLDSMATLQIPGEGYGLHYDYGIFKQEIVDGYQVEKPDHWIRFGYPWEIVRPEYQYTVQFGGSVWQSLDENEQLTHQWVDTEKVIALAHDIPIPGYRNDTVNTLRLWSAQATEEFELHEFNEGDYIGAMQSRIKTETITTVLYPKDDIPQGKELRLKQEYFFISATVQDIIRRHLVKNKDLENFHEKVVMQLNDTHPALAIVELMRLLLDEQHMSWEQAWEITRHSFAYTNHTVLPEALELWSVDSLARLLPRHLQLIYEINFRFLNEIRETYSDAPEILSRMSLIQEAPYKAVRMANLALVGSYAVNGVSELHTEIVKERIFPDFYNLWPEKFSAKTNGITQRRWLKLSNPRLAAHISKHMSEDWIRDLHELQKLKTYMDDTNFCDDWRAIKLDNKKELASYIDRELGIQVNPESIFDIQVKRIHEYKRQLMNLLHVCHLYNRLKDGNAPDIAPRTVIFAGKAAPGYRMAKLIIKLIHDIADKINNDPEVKSILKVVFLPNYSVSLAQKIFPAADLSEQISTAGLEASGTGNMKFALNGALTIGTLDGANIEIKEEVGDDNIFIFGLTVDDIARIRTDGYNPWEYYESNHHLKTVIDMLSNDIFNIKESRLYIPIVNSLLKHGDKYMVMADFQAYCDCQRRVDEQFRDPRLWTKKSIINTASMGKFSSDRVIKEYAREIWKTAPVRPQVYQNKKFI